MGLSRLRWILAGAVALVALVATVKALDIYIAHALTVGVLAVAALALTLAVGLTSLARARLRIGRELSGLQANPPGGSLLQARRARLQAIKATGARPDRDALAEAVAAEEAGRAYIGRYLVATTVLIGLVGTFAGLMETLGKVSPLLGETGTGGLVLLAEPLAGLHVTFGASLVAMLATLSLALAQGDLALHEGQALAALEDRTTHDLIPALWPAADEAGERTARAMEELRTALAEAVAGALEGGSRRLADSTRAEGERTVRALEGVATTVQKEVARLCAAVTAGLEEGTRRQGAALAEATASIAGKAAAATEEGVRRSTAIAEVAVKTAAAQLESTLAPLFTAEAAQLESVRDGLQRAAVGIEQAVARLGEVGGVVENLSKVHADAVEQAGKGVLAAFDRAVLSGGAALGGAASALAAAARDLRTGAEVFGPKMAALSTELQALSRELALLAARDPEGDLSTVVLGEIERLGAGVERLTELLRLSEPKAEAPAEPAESEHAAADEPPAEEAPS